MSSDAGARTSDSGERERTRLDADCRIEQTRPLEETLGRRLIGQDEAVDELVCAYSRLLADLHDPSRPLLTAMLLGPTGVGKTETARALAQTLFGSEDAMTRINCEEYAEGHELSKLLGSPPGYVGGDIEPLLSQESIDGPHREAREAAAEGGDAPPSPEPPSAGAMGHPDEPEEAPGEVLADRLFGREPGEFVSVILFDEIEKAHPKLWNALLGVLDDGMLTLGNNRQTDFSRSIILMTSNVGSREMSELLEGRSIGFTASDGQERDEMEPSAIEETALREAREVFPFEFLNRLDQVLVYRPLSRDHLGPIFDKFLDDLQRRILTRGGVPVLLKVSPAAKELIIDRGADLKFGARPLRRAMERDLLDPLSRLIASGDLEPGDVLEVGREDEELAFYRASRGSDRIVA